MMGPESRLGEGCTALVTGGGGFLGKAIVRALLERKVRVRSLARGAHPELTRWGVDEVRGDIRDARVLRGAVSDCDVVFHVAAKTGVWGPAAEYREINVYGTRNVVEACRAMGTKRLVFTSTPSVVFGERDLEGVDESTPYPDRYACAYPETKALAERRVVDANCDELATVCLRPHLIWGPEDPQFLPRLAARARAGRLIIVGDAQNRVDTIYIDNAADAHLCAADRLFPGSAIAGRCYFITQGEPIALWDMVGRLMAAIDEPGPRRRLSARNAYRIGALLEGLYGLLRIRREPPMTRFLALELSKSHWFDISAARRELGYEPRVKLNEGLERLADWWSRKAVSEVEASGSQGNPGQSSRAAK